MTWPQTVIDDLDDLRREVLDKHRNTRECWALYCMAIEAERKASEAYANAITALKEPRDA